MEWQPIDTAPKDGTRIRLGHDMDPTSMKIDTIFPHYGAYSRGGWGLNAFFVLSDGFMTSKPTHWMPTPPVSP